MNHNQRLGERFRSVRLVAGMSQQQVADACGVSKMTVSKWERGLVRLTSRHILRFGKETGCNAAYFLQPIQVEVAWAMWPGHTGYVYPGND